jgi:hypothetical protein
MHGSVVDGLLAVGGDVDGVSLLAQASGNEVRHAGFVFHQQDSHCSLFSAIDLR